MKTPNLANMKVVFLLEWTEPWEDGHGFNHIHTVYGDYEAAMAAGHDAIRHVFSDDNEEEMKRNFSIFDHAREDNVHYCGGVILKPVPYFP